MVGGQDCHAEAKGAFTGSISAPMLKDAGAKAVLVGHSERRHGLGETDAMVRAKAAAGLAAGLLVVLCIGETEAQREAGETVEVLERQLAGSWPEGATADNTVVAYEPVWAIGTGRTATTADIAESHAAIGRKLAALASRAASPSFTAARSRPITPPRSWPCPASPVSSWAGRPWMRPGSGPSTRRAVALEPGLAAVSNPATDLDTEFPFPP